MAQQTAILCNANSNSGQRAFTPACAVSDDAQRVVLSQTFLVSLTLLLIVCVCRIAALPA